MQNQSFGFIGGGRITYILLEALRRQNVLPEDIIISDPDCSRHEQLKKLVNKNITCTNDNKQAAKADIIFLAVHPPAVPELLNEISDEIQDNSVLISLIPVWTIETLSKGLGGHQQIIRMIPNAPSIIGSGYNPVCFSKEISPGRKQELLKIFARWGECPEVLENQLEGFAVMTGMGPTYFWPQFNKLKELGISFGLEKEQLRSGLLKMISGSAELMFNSDLNSDQVQDLIPVYPLKESEEMILNAFETKLTGLHLKLESARK